MTEQSTEKAPISEQGLMAIRQLMHGINMTFARTGCTPLQLCTALLKATMDSDREFKHQGALIIKAQMNICLDRVSQEEFKEKIEKEITDMVRSVQNHPVMGVMAFVESLRSDQEED